MKRILAIALSLCMIVTLMPMNVAMANTEKPVPEGVFVGYDEIEEQFIVSVKEDKRNNETLAYLKDIKIIEINAWSGRACWSAPRRPRRRPSSGCSRCPP